MNKTTELAMTLARSALEEQAERIQELEEALRAFNLKEEWIVSGTSDTLTLRVPIAVIQQAEAVLNKGKK